MGRTRQRPSGRSDGPQGPMHVWAPRRRKIRPRVGRGRSTPAGADLRRGRGGFVPPAAGTAADARDSPEPASPADYGVTAPDPPPALPPEMDVFTPPLLGGPDGPPIAEFTRTAGPDQTIVAAGPDSSAGTRFRFYGQTMPQDRVEEGTQAGVDPCRVRLHLRSGPSPPRVAVQQPRDQPCARRTRQRGLGRAGPAARRASRRGRGVARSTSPGSRRPARRSARLW